MTLPIPSKLSAGGHNGPRQGAAYAANAAAAAANAAYAANAAIAANLIALLDGLLDQWELAAKAEDEDLYRAEEWEDAALAFVSERMAEQS